MKRVYFVRMVISALEQSKAGKRNSAVGGGVVGDLKQDACQGLPGKSVPGSSPEGWRESLCIVEMNLAVEGSGRFRDPEP